MAEPTKLRDIREPIVELLDNGTKEPRQWHIRFVVDGAEYGIAVAEHPEFRYPEVHAVQEVLTRYWRFMQEYRND